VALIHANSPDSEIRAIEVSVKPWTNFVNRRQIHWSADSKHLAIPHMGSVSLLDLEQGREYVIPQDNCDLLGVASGPRLVMGCYSGRYYSKPLVRLVNLTGKTSSEMSLPKGTLASGFSPENGWVALAIPDATLDARMVVNSFRGFVVLHVDDQREIARWQFSESYGWSGAFSPKGSQFCNTFYDRQKAGWMNIACRDLISGERTDTVRAYLGNRQANRMMIGRSRITIEHSPPGKITVWETTSGRSLATLAIKAQKLLPKSSWPAEFLHGKEYCPYALAPDGGTLVEGCSGNVTAYNLP
jgi:hypothetical protein